MVLSPLSNHVISNNGKCLLIATVSSESGQRQSFNLFLYKSQGLYDRKLLEMDEFEELSLRGEFLIKVVVDGLCWYLGWEGGGVWGGWAGRERGDRWDRDRECESAPASVSDRQSTSYHLLHLTRSQVSSKDPSLLAALSAQCRENIIAKHLHPFHATHCLAKL